MYSQRYMPYQSMQQVPHQQIQKPMYKQNKWLPKIVKTDFKQKNLPESVNEVAVAYLRYSTLNDKATYIKNEFDRLFGKTHCCFIYMRGLGGWNFAAKPNHMIHLEMGNDIIIVFKELED